ncbi:MAG TPA: hypothetical protein VMW47_03470 [Verrucomicrobiae bacterium]|nr:hypothetical protein [Verrucomicrobiae bacterium]
MPKAPPPAGFETDLESVPERLARQDRLEPDELRQVWSMLDGGAIMVADVRHQLWRSWGLCRRHSWVFAAMEIECLGGQPRASTVLYEDLVARGARITDRAGRLPWRLGRRALQRRAACLTCEFVQMVHRLGEGRYLISWDRDARTTRRMQRLTRTIELIAAAEPAWRGRACPRCLGGDGPLCRPHLVETAPTPREHRHTVEALDDLAIRVARLGRSMTWQGPPAGPDDRSSWVEALGWAGGWSDAQEIVA